MTDKARFLVDLNGYVLLNPTSVRAAGFGLADEGHDIPTECGDLVSETRGLIEGHEGAGVRDPDQACVWCLLLQAFRVGDREELVPRRPGEQQRQLGFAQALSGRA